MKTLEFVKLLKVGSDYYFYKERQMAGIPIKECQKNRQWYLKLNDMDSKNPTSWKEVPSAWLPRRY